MTEKKLYTCDICNTDYADKESAKKCESNHRPLESATIIGEYRSLKSMQNGIPVKIKVKFDGMRDFITYQL